jgi:FHA domain
LTSTDVSARGTPGPGHSVSLGPVSDQLFIVLRVCLLALVYLVFFRVLRAVWVELRAEGVPTGAAMTPTVATRRAPRPAPVTAQAPAGGAGSGAAGSPPARLVVVAPASLVGLTFGLDGETTIGRGAGCGVAIDDAHVSKLHARVYPHEGTWLVEDLGSTNGTSVDGAPISGPTPLAPGGRISIGEIVMELA